jgi:heme/copper-type cytochrome/quinol oxidase subunit 1
MSKTPRTLGVIAALLIVVGAVVVVTAPAQSFGWFAYAPLSGDVYNGPGRFSLPMVLGGRQLLGLAAVVIGLVLAGLAVGIRLGQRQTR